MDAAFQAPEEAPRARPAEDDDLASPLGYESALPFLVAPPPAEAGEGAPAWPRAVSA